MQIQNRQVILTNVKHLLPSFCLALLIILAGCRNNNTIILSSKNPTYIGKNSKSKIANSASYVGSGFTSTPKNKLDKLGNKKDKGSHNRYPVKPGNTFKGSFFIDNHDKRREYAVVALLDYKQIPLKISGKNKLLHYIIMGQNERHNFTMQTPKLASKRHDFIILSFFSPNNHSLEQEVRETSEFAFSNGRANLIAKNNAPPKYKYLKTKSYPSKDFSGIMLNFDKDPMIFDAVKKVKPSRDLRYSIHIGNTSKTTSTYAITAFLDYNQILVTKQKTIFVKIKPGRRIRVQTRLRTPAEKGIHELLIIANANPFIELPESNEKVKIDISTYSTNRTALKVQ